MRWHVELFDRHVADEIDSWPVALRASLLKIVERIQSVGLELQKKSRKTPPHYLDLAEARAKEIK